MTQRLLITGGTGFVGIPTVRLARQQRYDVTVAGRTAPPTGVAHVAVDLLRDDPAALIAEVKPDLLIHLAWIATPGVYWDSAENARWHEASTRLLEAFASSSGHRAVIAGTCAEYDWTSSEDLNEDHTPLRPSSPYGRAKRALHDDAARLAEHTGLQIAWARLFFLYGPGEAETRLVPSLATGLLRGEPVACTTGHQVRDYLHVEDAAAALVHLLGTQVTGAVNVASGTGVTVRRIAELVGATTRRGDLIQFGEREGPRDPSRIVADTSRLNKDVAWRPGVSLEAGIAEAVAWWDERR